MTEEQKGWGGARPGAGRPRKSPPHFEPDQWALIAEALREYASLNCADDENVYSEMAGDIEQWQLARIAIQKRFDDAMVLVREEERIKEERRINRKGVKGGVSLDSV